MRVRFVPQGALEGYGVDVVLILFRHGSLNTADYRANSSYIFILIKVIGFCWASAPRAATESIAQHPFRSALSILIAPADLAKLANWFQPPPTKRTNRLHIGFV